MKIIASIILSLALALNLFAQEHPKSASPFTQSLTEAYLALQSSLANDDLNGANEAALAYVAAFDKSTANLNVEKLTSYANEVASAPDLASARTAFKGLSSQAKMLFDYLATPESDPLYLVSCSMAFDGEGAEWIQATREVSNPYYGAMMPRCGTVTRSIGSSPKGMHAPNSQESCPPGTDPAACGKAASDSCCNK